MAQTVGRLTATHVRNAKPGMHADGAGLYLQVTNAYARSWIFKFTLRGKAREMGLGPARDVGLAEARTKAMECRNLAREGVDPIEARRIVRAQNAFADASAMTFKEAATAYIKNHRAGWKSPKHAAQWEATLAAYAYPHFGAVPVQAVEVGLVMKALEPIWSTKPETAGRVRGRIEAVLDWAKVRGFRKGENPARWRGHLEKLLPARSKVRKVRHHPALPFAEMPAFMPALRCQEGIAARALEFTILTAARTGETIGARWPEFDTQAATWTVPGERMKGGREHRVPLSEPALAILEAIREHGAAAGDAVFPGGRHGKPLSNMAMLETLRRMGRIEITVHGFRSSFMDWARERTNFPRELREAALAHAIDDETEAAYARGDLFEKRRRLMDAWGQFCCKPSAARTRTVIPLRRSIAVV